MKKFIVSSMILLGFTGCVADKTEDFAPVRQGVEMSFVIDDSESRTTISDQQIAWQDGDKVGVFVANAATPTVNAEGTITVKNGVASVAFKAADFSEGDVVSAYYPYDATVTDPANVTFTIPTTQYQSKANAYNGAYHPMISITKPFAKKDGESVTFRPTCAIVQFNISTSNTAYEGEKVQKVLFRSCTPKEYGKDSDWITGKYACDITTISEAVAPDFSAKESKERNDESWLAEVVFDTPMEVTAEKQQAYMTLLPGAYNGFFIVITDKAEYMYIYKATPTMTESGEVDFSKEPTTTADLIVPFKRNTVKQIPLDLGNTGKLANRNAHTPITNFAGYRRDVTFGASRGQNRIFKGVFVSDADSKNMAQNTNTAYNKVDTSASELTGYFQQEDGGLGYRVKFDKAEDNIFHKGDHVLINMSGTEIKKETTETGATAYTIYGLKPQNILQHETGTITKKVKKIEELTDDDIYTYTTLSDMEFVFKQGAYTNVDEAYVLASELNKGVANLGSYGDGATRLMQDNTGKAIQMQINTLCQWRRKLNATAEGNHGVPQGVGYLNGIVVSNLNTHSGDVDGFIGKYSIRPVDESDIAGEQAIPWAATQARTTLAAWNFDNGVAYNDCYKNNKKSNPYKWNTWVGNDKANINKMCATDGDETALLWCDNLAIVTDSIQTKPYNTVINFRPQFTDGVESEYVWSGDNTNGYCKASSTEDCLALWVPTVKFCHRCGSNAYGDYTWVTNLTGWYDWNEDGTTYSGTKGFNIALSTAATSKPLTINFSIGAGGNMVADWKNYIGQNIENSFHNSRNGYYSQNYPLYWKVQYSTDGGASWQDGAVDAVTGADKFVMRPMACTDLKSPVYYAQDTKTTVGSGSYPNIYMSLGLSEYSFVLPAEASGQANLIIRLTPADTEVGSRFSGPGNYKLKLNYKAQKATQASSFGNMIHIGGIAVQY